LLGFVEEKGGGTGLPTGVVALPMGCVFGVLGACLSQPEAKVNPSAPGEEEEFDMDGNPLPCWKKAIAGCLTGCDRWAASPTHRRAGPDLGF
jgi:hypothetical protein